MRLIKYDTSLCLLCDQLPIALEVFVFDPQVIDGNAVVDAPLGVMIRAVDDILVTSAPQLCLTKTPPDNLCRSK